MYQDEATHEQIMAAFRAYFEENQTWMNGGSHSSSIRLRHRLSDIRNACSARRVAVREWQVEKLAQLKARRLARKQGTEDDQNTN
jgi:hypothetical protein